MELPSKSGKNQKVANTNDVIIKQKEVGYDCGGLNWIGNDEFDNYVNGLYSPHSSCI